MGTLRGGYAAQLRRVPQDQEVSDMSEAITMPALFVGHGSPMNTLETNRWTTAWAEFGAQAPRPRAILAVSAHWYINATAVTAMATPRTIHDFFGFPPELFAYEYAAPGLPELAEEIAEVAKPTWVGLDLDSWGLDHGTWSVLAHMFPQADIPVVQLSVDATKPAEDHVALGAALAPLRETGVMVIASGNVVHNLRRIDWSRPDAGFDWAYAFDDAANELMADRPGDIAALVDHEAYELAAPTPDHLMPLYYVAGLAAAAGTGTSILTDGATMGSLTMTSHLLAA
jgi:4,5-DOPA dioxygenase extradiol